MKRTHIYLPDLREISCLTDAIVPAPITAFVGGGGKTDMSFLAAGVLDELSLVLSPTVSGEPETASVFDEMPRSAGGSHVFSLERVERLAGDGLHLVYRVQR